MRQNEAVNIKQVGEKCEPLHEMSNSINRNNIICLSQIYLSSFELLAYHYLYATYCVSFTKMFFKNCVQQDE